MIDLKHRLSQRELLVAPGVCDPLTAEIAGQTGAEAVYLSGASIAYTRLGRPDIGLVSMAEVADVIAQVRDRVELPLIVDGDTGYGNALNVQRTVRVFERMGATAIQLEDQSLPKRCGHLAGKTLVSTAEMVGKIHAALDARASEATLLVARTDAIAVEGFASALDRAEAYLDAGADVLFIEAPRSEAEMAAVTERFANRVPLLANMVEGGNTPIRNTAALEALGFSLAIFPGGAVRAMAAAAARYYQAVIEQGETASLAGEMHDFSGLNAVIGTNDMLALGARYGES